MDSEERDTPSRSIGRYISHINMNIRSYLGRELEPYGIGSGQVHFLLYLYRHDVSSQERISEGLKVDKATTTRALNKLRELGYISRKRDPCDKRRYLVHLTEKGLDLEPEIRKVLDGWTRGVTRGFGSDELDLLFGFLERLEKNSGDLP